MLSLSFSPPWDAYRKHLSFEKSKCVSGPLFALVNLRGNHHLLEVGGREPPLASRLIKTTTCIGVGQTSARLTLRLNRPLSFFASFVDHQSQSFVLFVLSVEVEVERDRMPFSMRDYVLYSNDNGD